MPDGGTQTPLPTPAPREDGRCLTCLGPRGAIPKTLVNRTARTLKAALAADGFCSTTCARSYYGTSLPEVGSGPRGPQAKKVGRPAGPLMHGTEHAYRTCHCESCRVAATAARRERRTRGGKAA